MQEQLIEQVERGGKLPNPAAAAIYDLQVERGVGPFRQIRITPHAQYRMDLRGVTVNDLRLSIGRYLKQLNDWKSQGSWRYKADTEALARGQTVEWLDKKQADLITIFAGHGRGAINIVTTYWKGLPDPRPEACPLPKHAKTVEDMSGFRTFVKNPSPSKSDTDTGKYKTQGLPSPPWTKSKPLGPMMFNVPPESGGSGDGKSIHKDKARTKGVPGGYSSPGAAHTKGVPGEYSSPDNSDVRIGPVRRPGLNAMGDDDDLDLLAEWDDAILAGMYPPSYPGSKRQRKQKSRAYLYFHKRYKRQRGSILRNVKRRQKRLRNNGRFKRDRERRDERPERFVRRPGGGAKSIKERSQNQRDRAKKAGLHHAIPFLHFPSEIEGLLIEVSPLFTVHYEVDGVRYRADFESFFDEVVFFDDDDIEAVQEHLDEVFDYHDDDEVFDYHDDDDVLFDAWVDGNLKMAFAGIRVKRRPDKRRRRQRGTQKIKARMRYKRNKVRNRMRAKKRYKRLKKNPAFKKQQQIRRKHPERFRMRRGDVLTAPEIAFVIGSDLDLAYVRSVSGMTGMVTFHRNRPGENVTSFESAHIQVFMEGVVFLSDEDMDEMFRLVETEIGPEAWGDLTAEAIMAASKMLDIDCTDPAFKAECMRLVGKSDLSAMTEEELLIIDSNLVTQIVYDSGFTHDDDYGDRDDGDPAEPFLIDPQDDDHIYGVVNLPEDYAMAVGRVARRFVMADLGVYEKRPPKMDPGTYYDRANDPQEHRKRRDIAPGDKLLQDYLQEVMNSNPGSRVYPGGKDHMEKRAALMGEIRDATGQDIHARSKNLQAQLRRVDRKNAMWLFDVPGSSAPYRVRLKAHRKGNVLDLAKIHVAVSCSCAFWQWQGPEHWAKQGDYLYGTPRGTASRPGIKDPSGKHRACKHVLAVFRHVLSNQWQISSRGKQGSLRYLADTLREGEVFPVTYDFDQASRRVAARYLATRRC